MNLKLIEPCLDIETAFMEMLQEFRNSSSSVPFVMHFEKNTFQEILQATIDNSNGIDIIENMEPSTTWWLINEYNSLLGIVNIRHKLNEYLTNYGGHIGYGIRPAERNKGYATKLLALALEKCTIMGLERILITCDRRNAASEKVILKNGGILEDERIYNGMIMRRYWIPINNLSSPFK